MKAIRIKKPLLGDPAWSSTHPPSPDMMELIGDAPLPRALHTGDLIVKVKAASVVRDNLTWPELYTPTPAHLGNDFAGIVTESLSPDFQPGDEVFGMVAADRGGTWSEYILIRPEEVSKKPTNLSWESAAALPLSALTADQALFTHASLNTHHQPRILITGASGAVGTYLTQFALTATQQVTAATSSTPRNAAFLSTLGAKNIIEYTDLPTQAPFDIIVDTVGGEILKSCWSVLKPGGSLISVDSASWNFVDEHRALGLMAGLESIKAAFFIVKPERESLGRVAAAVERAEVKVVVAETFALEQFREAYVCASERGGKRGRVVLTF